MRAPVSAVRIAGVLLTLGWLGAVLLGAESKPRGKSEPPISDAERAHWAFRRPVRPPMPRGASGAGHFTPVDAFVGARLQAAGLGFGPAAERTALLRRVTFDLTGLPPRPSEVACFVADNRPDAYARAVERLLASPRYGEHWAQHWLDVARYAESNGYEMDAERTHAWRYRDYVIHALNEDMPYDRFVVEQLAGDELARAALAGRNGAKAKRSVADDGAREWLFASGFNRCGPIHLVSGNTDLEINRQEVLTEMTASAAATFLGLTLGCARCHNHKFDPISQADYYRFQAFFAACQPADVEISSAAERAAFKERAAAIEARIAPLRQEVQAIEAPCRQRLESAKTARLESTYRAALAVAPAKRTEAQRKLASEAAILTKVTWDEIVAALKPVDRVKRAGLRSRIHDLEAAMPAPPAQAWTVKDEASTPPTHVLVRGDPKRKGPIVAPSFPRVLTPAARSRRTSGKSDLDGVNLSAFPRLRLARWLTRADHPLAARVMVNRIWQHHFGRGLVTTPNDFGLRGEPPTHPELLDWLACEFVASGWSVKHMHRLMVLSKTYRQASRALDVRARDIDPENRLLWHMPRRRLEGEALRDSVLAVAGVLNQKMAGPMIRAPLEPEVYELIFSEGEPDGLWLTHPDTREHGRRSIYLFAKRNVRLPLLEAFDRPDSLTSCPVRPVSTFAPQALILMNGPFMQEQSKRFACRLLRECGQEADRLIDRGYRLALGRAPREIERRAARSFLREQAGALRERALRGRPIPVMGDNPDPTAPEDAAALADFCLALLNCNEFVYFK